MSNTFYSQYVDHCLRFYVRHSNPKFYRESDKNNWIACDTALKEFSDNEKEIFFIIYKDGNVLSDNIYHVARCKGVSQDVIWKSVNELRCKIAKKRGLL